MNLKNITPHPVLVPLLLFLTSIVIAYKSYNLDFKSMIAFPWIFAGLIFLFGGISLFSQNKKMILLRAILIIGTTSISIWGAWAQDRNLLQARQSHEEQSLLSFNNAKAKLQEHILGVNISESKLDSIIVMDNKITIINFWATWCAPCREDLPLLEKFWLKHKQSNLNMIALTRFFKKKTLTSRQEEINAVKELTDEFSLTLPVGIDTIGVIFKDYNVKPIPCIVLINEKGIVIDYGVGIDGTKEILEKAEALLEL